MGNNCSQHWLVSSEWCALASALAHSLIALPSASPSMGTAMAHGNWHPSGCAVPSLRSFSRRDTSAAAVLLPLPGTPAIATMYLHSMREVSRHATHPQAHGRANEPDLAAHQSAEAAATAPQRTSKRGLQDPIPCRPADHMPPPVCRPARSAALRSTLMSTCIRIGLRACIWTPTACIEAAVVAAGYAAQSLGHVAHAAPTHWRSVAAALALHSERCMKHEGILLPCWIDQCLILIIWQCRSCVLAMNMSV